MSVRQECLPSPVKKHILWNSPLKGMERPVRSFKSFIRSVPPNPSPQNHKPLPPTPATPDSSVLVPTPLLPVPASSERISTCTTWKAPAEWEWNQASPSPDSLPTSSLFSARNYSLLLPESSPSPGAGDIPVDPGAWPFESSVLPRPQPEHLTPIQEGSTDKLNVPPRNHSRHSLSTIVSAESDAGMMSASMEFSQPRALPGISTSASVPETSSDIYLQTTEPQSSNFSHRVSDASTKARAFASLGIGSPRDSETPWEDWKNTPDHQVKDEDDLANLTIHSKKSRPHHQEHTRIDNTLEDDELTQKLQQLSFAQDYHKVLTEQYHSSDRRDRNRHSLLLAPTNRSNHSAPPQFNALSKDHELFPQPLTWKKDSKDPSPAASSPNLAYQTKPVSKPKRRHKRIVSWVQLSHEQQRDRHSADQDFSERSTNESAVSPRKQIRESEVDKLLIKDIRLPNLLAHTKRLRSPREHTEVTKTKDVDQSRLGSASPSPSHEKPSSVMRLPGGFAIVRQAPSETPHSQTASSYDVSASADSPRKGSRPNSNASSPRSISHASQQRLSQYSQQSQAPVAPTVAVKRLHDSTGSASSPLSRSNNSTPSTSPLAQEVPLPRTPPLIPASPSRPSNPPRVSSPLSHEHETVLHERHTENDEEHSTHMHKILDKAKGARSAWRKHQQDVKHEKLKQSIRVLGPTDPAVTAGYVKREGRRPGEEDLDSSRMPGYMVTGPL